MPTVKMMKDVFAQRTTRTAQGKAGRSQDSQSRPASQRIPEKQDLCPVLISISRMTDDEIGQMSTNDLIDLLALSTSAPQWGDFVGEVPQSGPAGLRLLALLARRCCRDAVQNVCRRQGYPVPQYPVTAS